MSKDPLEPIIITRTRKGRRPRRRIKISAWIWRVGTATIALALVGRLASMGAEPYAKRLKQEAESAQLLATRDRLKDENAQLRRQIHRLGSGQGLDVEARSIGYIRKGEIPLLLTFDAPAPSHP